MKDCFLVIALASLGVAQSTTSQFTTDINGHTVSTTSTASDSQRTELSQSVNGRQVPLERTEEKVLHQDADGKVIEKVVRKYDPNGELVSTERLLTTTQKLSDGGSLARVTTYRSDVNGNLQEAERKSTETHSQGNVTRSETTTDRPTLNGSFQTAEKRSSVIDTSNGNTHAEETVYRRSDNGTYYPALRQVMDEQKTTDKTVVQTASFEPGVTGSLQLASQSVSTTTKRPDGSEESQVNLYARAADGRVQENGAPMQIKEQQVIERQKTADGVVETLSVRRPTLADPTRLGNMQKLSETVCKGKCIPDAPDTKP